MSNSMDIGNDEGRNIANALSLSQETGSLLSLTCEMGIRYQPEVIGQLLEIMQRYTRSVLKDAEELRKCASKDSIGK